MADQSQGRAKNTESGEKPPLPLFYINPMPLDAKKHGTLSLKPNFGLHFASKINAVPINMIEMPQICHVYPIAFSPDESATPVALMGLRDHENLFINADGEWLQDTYIPAYVRRYPFIFSEIPDSDQLTLCIDNNPDVLDNKGSQIFFEQDGTPSTLARNALEFCKSYHAAAQQTQAFSRALAASGLLVERNAEINIGDGRRINFSGFRIIDEQKLAALPDAEFMEWRRRGWLPFIYAHFFSGAQWQRMSSLLRARLETGETSKKKN